MYHKERFLNKPCIYTENKNTIFKNRYEEHLVIVKEIKEDEDGIAFAFFFCETLEEHKIFISRKLLEKEIHNDLQVLYAIVDSEKKFMKKKKKENKFLIPFKTKIFFFTL